MYTELKKAGKKNEKKNVRNTGVQCEAIRSEHFEYGHFS